MAKKTKRPQDIKQIAKNIVNIATGKTKPPTRKVGKVTTKKK